MAAALLSLLLFTGAVQDTTVEVSQEALRELESRVQNLESRVQRYESAESYFKTVLNSERVWWSTLVLVIISVGGIIGYNKVSEEVEKVSEEMENFRDEFGSLKDEQLKYIHHLSMSESNIYSERGNYTRSLISLIHAIESITKKSEIDEVEKHNIKLASNKALEYLNKSIKLKKSISINNYNEIKESLSKLMNETEGETKINLANLYEKVDDLILVDKMGEDSAN